MDFMMFYFFELHKVYVIFCVFETYNEKTESEMSSRIISS